MKETIDRLLLEIFEKGHISTSKDDPEKRRILNLMHSFKLISKSENNTFRLLPDGLKAIELGGFEKWKTHTENISNPDLSVIIGDNNIVYQRLSLKNDLTVNTTPTTIPNEKANRQNATKSAILKFWWKILIPIIVGLIILLIERLCF